MRDVASGEEGAKERVWATNEREEGRPKTSKEGKKRMQISQSD